MSDDPRGVIELVNRHELWQAFGGYGPYLAAPLPLIETTALILRAKQDADEARSEEMREQSRRAGGS